jgi:hypothetical protein
MVNSFFKFIDLFKDRQVGGTEAKLATTKKNPTIKSFYLKTKI